MKWIALILVFLSSCTFGTERAETSKVTPVAVVAMDGSNSELELHMQLPGQTDEKSVAEIVDDEVDDVPVAEKKPKPVVKKVKKRSKKNSRRKTLKPAIIRIITNFDKADATVNGLVYPEYTKPGETEGMVLPAGGPYRVKVTFDGKEKNYELKLRPYETRLLFVELTGFGGGSKPAPVKPKKEKAEKKVEKKEEKKDDKDDPGKITIYSKPAGTVMIDGKSMGERTPATIEVENGRHEVQVQYEGADISEKKIVRVRNGSRIKLFFRERKK